jgi:hypothetical protein
MAAGRPARPALPGAEPPSRPGSGYGREEPTAMIPQSRPPASTGTPTAARTPMARTFSVTGPLALL